MVNTESPLANTYGPPADRGGPLFDPHERPSGRHRSPSGAGVGKGWGMPPLGVTEPFNGGDEGLWENLHLLEFMALLMGQTS